MCLISVTNLKELIKVKVVFSWLKVIVLNRCKDSEKQKNTVNNTCVLHVFLGRLHAAVCLDGYCLFWWYTYIQA